LQISPGSGYDLIDKPFGFFEVEVTAPKDIKIPLLQKRMHTTFGNRTIALVEEGLILLRK